MEYENYKSSKDRENRDYESNRSSGRRREKESRSRSYKKRSRSYKKKSRSRSHKKRSRSRHRSRQRSRERHSKHTYRREESLKKYGSSSRRSESYARRKPGSRRKYFYLENRTSRFWDVPPPNCENITPADYKDMIIQGRINLSCLVSLIPGMGVPFNEEIAALSLHVPPVLVTPQFPPGAGGLMGLAAMSFNGYIPGIIPGLGMPDMTLAHISKQAKKLYVGNLPFQCNEQKMMQYFQEQMATKGLSKNPIASVVSVQINYDKNFAFVEFNTIEETTNATGLDGIVWCGQALKIRRPKDYIPVPNLDASYHSYNYISTENKIYIEGLPEHFNEDEVKELLSLYGELKLFNLIKDPITNQSKGHAYCEYCDPGITDTAIEGLNGMPIGDKALVVQRAMGNSTGDRTSMAMGLALNSKATEVLVLINMVEINELVDDEEYEDLKEDIREECSKYGTLVDIAIPRPSSDGSKVSGLGKVYLRYSTLEEAQLAQAKTTGRKFADRTVLTAFLDTENFDSGEFE